MLVSIQQNCIWCCLWLQAIFLSLCSQKGTVNASASICHPANNLFVFVFVFYSPTTGNGCDFRERQLQQDLLLVIYNIDASPVDSDDDIILGQAGPRKLVGLVETGKQQRPFVHGITHHIFFHLYSQRHMCTSSMPISENIDNRHLKSRHKGWDFHMIKI